MIYGSDKRHQEKRDFNDLLSGLYNDLKEKYIKLKEAAKFLKFKKEEAEKKLADQCWLNSRLIAERDRLKGENLKLKQEINQFNHAPKIRLSKYQELEKRFWEVMEELRELRKVKPDE